MRANSSQLENMLSNKVKTDIAMSNTEHGKFKGLDNMQPVGSDEKPDTSNTNATPTGGGNVDDVYNELIHMRKMNRVLGQRIKQLEVQNFHMTAQGFNQSGFKSQEPSRPIFSGGDDAVGMSPPRPSD